MPEPEPEPVEEDDDDALARALRTGWLGGAWPPETHWLTRFAFLRGLGLVYLVAFVILARQMSPLFGAGGILPARWHLDDVAAAAPSRLGALWSLPTLFWIDASDATLTALCALGLALSAAVLAGYANVPILATLWAVYLSFVHVGQTWYGYGWEILLLEAGFLACFLAPVGDGRPLRAAAPPPPQVVWLLRWLAFRLMFGAGLIKLRGDPCWTELTCLDFHYETQPVPGPLSPWFHAHPAWLHRAGVLFNHVVELVAPWGVFGPRRVRHAAGVLLVAFQLTLILSGNLSFLNWLTLVVCLACFDDSLLGRLAPARLRAAAAACAALDPAPSRARRVASWGLVVVVAFLSLGPVVNMLSYRQRMNASFEPFHLVNTYGAFGSVGRVRREVVLEGTAEAAVGEDTRWLEYELPCKPGDVRRPPCLVTPYHHRLDWQMWFAALGDYEREPWLVRLCYQLLRGDDAVRPLFAVDPFPDRPPRHVRARLFRYSFSDEPGVTWEREPVGEYLRPLSLGDPQMNAFLDAYGFRRDERAR